MKRPWTGVGHARLIFARFGRFWGWFSVGDLFLLNFLTVVTEFIGVRQALGYFGVSPYLSVPLAAVGLVLLTVTGGFRRWERWMYGFIAVSLLMFPLAFLSHPTIGPVVRDTFIPRVQGGVSSDAVLLVIAIVGTTVAPWQLFFQQSNVVDKRITPRFMRYERTDTIIGALLTNLGAGALIIAAAFAFTHTAFAGQFTDATGVADGLRATAGRGAGAMFAIVLLDASILGAAAVTLSVSYAVGDVFGVKHSLHRSWRDARAFYGSFSALVAAAAAIVLLPQVPLGLITTGVQALAGVLLPSATAFLLLLCNDHDVLGPWVNAVWLNALTTVIVGVLLALSLILVLVTLLPGLNVTLVALGMGLVLAIGLLVIGALHWFHRQPSTEVNFGELLGRYHWRTPPLEQLAPPRWSQARTIGMVALRGYLVIATLLLVVKVVQLAVG